MEAIRSKDQGILRVASGGDKVYKDECVYCFNTPVNPLAGHIDAMRDTCPWYAVGV